MSPVELTEGTGVGGGEGREGVGEEPNHTTTRTPGPLFFNTLWLKQKTVIPYPKTISGE